LAVVSTTQPTSRYSPGRKEGRNAGRNEGRAEGEGRRKEREVMDHFKERRRRGTRQAQVQDRGSRSKRRSRGGGVESENIASPHFGDDDDTAPVGNHTMVFVDLGDFMSLSYPQVFAF
jgi:hypothetical protein